MGPQLQKAIFLVCIIYIYYSQNTVIYILEEKIEAHLKKLTKNHTHTNLSFYICYQYFKIAVLYLHNRFLSPKLSDTKGADVKCFKEEENFEQGFASMLLKLCWKKEFYFLWTYSSSLNKALSWMYLETLLATLKETFFSVVQNFRNGHAVKLLAKVFKVQKWVT